MHHNISPLPNQIVKPVEQVVRISALLICPTALDQVKLDLNQSIEQCLSIWFTQNWISESDLGFVREQFVAALARLQVDAVIRSFEVEVASIDHYTIQIKLSWMTLGGAKHEWIL